MPRKKVEIDCLMWNLSVHLARFELADIYVEVPIDEEADPRASLIVNTERFAGAVSADEIEEAVNIYKLIWRDGRPSREGQELINELRNAIEKWMKKYIKCKKKEAQ